MSNKGYTVGTYIIKTEKKNSELSMCPICKKCKDRSVCQNRKNKKSQNYNFWDFLFTIISF